MDSPRGRGEGSTDSSVTAALGSLASYTARALESSPEMRAAFERWQAQVARISAARRLPEPTLSFGYFVRSVETRVGPQRAKLSLQQSFPWPTQISASGSSAAASARAMQRHFEAQVLALRAEVAAAYWQLWLIRRLRGIHAEHLEVVRGLSETVLARIATGAATLADQQQLALTAARLEDAIRGMDETEIVAEARLRSLTGLDRLVELPTTDDLNQTRAPRADEDELSTSLPEHPMIDALAEAAQAKGEAARAEGAKRLPGFSVRADWIITGPAAMPNVDESGKDAVMVGAGIRIPLWQRSYGGARDAAKAEARAHLADRDSAIDRAEAELAEALSAVRDSARRVELYSGTLIPQAQSAYESVLGSYTVGRSSVAQTLLAQRDLLELSIEVERARAQHASAWARLEFIVGHPVEAGAVADLPQPEPSPRESTATPDSESAKADHDPDQG